MSFIFKHCEPTLIMRLPVAAALAASLFLNAPAAMQTRTYEDSIREKDSAQCVQQERSNYERLKGFIERSTEARMEIQDIIYTKSLSEADKIAMFGDLSKKYGECVAMYAIFNPVARSRYERAGRTKPPLTGTYEEQAATIIREVIWERETLDAFARNVQREGSKRVRTVEQLKYVIGRLPEAVAADISIDNWNVSGTIWPRFNISDGEQGTIVIRPNAAAPGGRLESESGNFRLYSAQGGGFVLVQSYTSDTATTAYGSYSRGGLLRYRDFIEMPGGKTIAEKGRWQFSEFQKFINRLGTGFDGAARFKVSRTLKYLGDKSISFNQFGLRAQNNAGPKRLAVASYYSGSPESVDNDYINAFNDAFNDLSFGGQRTVMHLFPARSRHQGSHNTGVIDIRSESVGYDDLYVILEDLK